MLLRPFRELLLLKYRVAAGSLAHHFVQPEGHTVVLCGTPAREREFHPAAGVLADIEYPEMYHPEYQCRRNRVPFPGEPQFRAYISRFGEAAPERDIAAPSHILGLHSEYLAAAHRPCRDGEQYRNQERGEHDEDDDGERRTVVFIVAALESPVEHLVEAACLACRRAEETLVEAQQCDYRTLMPERLRARVYHPPVRETAFSGETEAPCPDGGGIELRKVTAYAHRHCLRGGTEPGGDELHVQVVVVVERPDNPAHTVRDAVAVVAVAAHAPAQFDAVAAVTYSGLAGLLGHTAVYVPLADVGIAPARLVGDAEAGDFHAVEVLPYEIPFSALGHGHVPVLGEAGAAVTVQGHFYVYRAYLRFCRAGD